MERRILIAWTMRIFGAKTTEVLLPAREHFTVTPAQAAKYHYIWKIVDNGNLTDTYNIGSYFITNIVALDLDNGNGQREKQKYMPRIGGPMADKKPLLTSVVQYTRGSWNYALAYANYIEALAKVNPPFAISVFGLEDSCDMCGGHCGSPDSFSGPLV